MLLDYQPSVEVHFRLAQQTSPFKLPSSYCRFNKVNKNHNLNEDARLRLKILNELAKFIHLLIDDLYVFEYCTFLIDLYFERVDY
jgi:hypothetical protein